MKQKNTKSIMKHTGLFTSKTDNWAIMAPWLLPYKDLTEEEISELVPNLV